MNKIILAFITSFSVCSVFAQWQGDIRLTNNSYGSFTANYSNGWAIASSGNTLHVTWHEYRDGNPEIYYKRSTDGGSTWEADVRLTNNTADSFNPSIAASGSAVYVAWYDKRSGGFRIYFNHSTDGGISWGTDTRLSDSTTLVGNPVVAVSGQNVYVAWDGEVQLGNNEIFYRISTDGGATWGVETRLTNAPNYSYDPSIAVTGSTVHIAWDDHRNVWPEIYYNHSTNGGLTWGTDQRLTPIDNLNSELPTIGVSGSAVHIVWVDARGSTGVDLYCRNSTDGGSTWGPETLLVNNSSNSFFPSIAVSGLNLHLVWDDNRDGTNHEIYYKRSTDAGITWGLDTRLTNNSNVSEHSFVSVSGSSVNVIWRDNRDNNFEIYYKRDPTGNPIGITNISSEIPEGYALSQNYPNPFNPATNIEFAVSKSGFVILTVFDITGKEISVPVNQNLAAGKYKVDFDASALSSGVYFYKLSAGDFKQTKKMILVK